MAPSSPAGRPLRRRSGQALLAALAAAAILLFLAAGLTSLMVESSQADQSARTQVSVMGIAEGGLNVTLRMLSDTVANALTQNLYELPRATAQGEAQSATSFGAAQAALATLLTDYGPLVPATAFPNTATNATAQSGGYLGATGTLPGPGGTYTWLAYVGIVTPPAPLPVWRDDGTNATMTVPIALLGYAWVWSPAGAYLGEMTLYSAQTTPGTLVVTYTDCPAYFTASACTTPTAVSISLPPGEIALNDVNVAIAAHP